MAIGGAIGYVLAVQVQMTQMPQLVALFNGLAAPHRLLVAGAEVNQSAVLLQRVDDATAAAIVPTGPNAALVCRWRRWTDRHGDAHRLFVAAGKLQELGILSHNALGRLKAISGIY